MIKYRIVEIEERGIVDVSWFEIDCKKIANDKLEELNSFYKNINRKFVLQSRQISNWELCS